jgi:hypothetical protein
VKKALERLKTDLPQTEKNVGIWFEHFEKSSKFLKKYFQIFEKMSRFLKVFKFLDFEWNLQTEVKRQQSSKSVLEWAEGAHFTYEIQSWPPSFGIFHSRSQIKIGEN